MLNPLSIVAHQAAYEHGEVWLEQMKAYLDENFRYVERFLTERLPEAKFRVPEATYLAWVDLSKCLPDVDDLPGFFANEAGVLLEGGNSLFVGNAEGFVRLNLAMPRSIIQTGMERIADSIERHKRGLC
jgi:cystathionine beta-lyase